jgi:phosphoribosylformylglycinamidine (FGAM) synthase-like amidotransferase family enzyme
VTACIPANAIEWTHAPGKFSFGDILRHLAAIESYLYAETVQLKPSD